MNSKALIFQNAKGEGPGILADCLERRGWDWKIVTLYFGENLPADWKKYSLLVRWGSEAQTTHCREGEAEYDVLLKGKMGDTSRSQTVPTRLQQIAKQAEDYPQMVFTTLAHHIDVDLLREAYQSSFETK